MFNNYLLVVIQDPGLEVNPMVEKNRRFNKNSLLTDR
jgi:hypothetical protein